MRKRDDAELTTRYADMFSAMGTEPRLRIVRLLLSAHPEGLVVGESGVNWKYHPAPFRIISTS